jgi:ribosome-binding protein aMBF1 (putative translation factor)
MPFRSSFTKPQSKDIAARVLEFRAEYGLSQTDLAKLMGVGRRTIANIELRYHQCFPGTWRKFLEAEVKMLKKSKAREELKRANWKEEANA